SPSRWRFADGCYRGVALCLLALAFIWAWRHPRRLRLAEGLSWGALTMVLLAPGLSPQYLLWAPALALAVSPRLCWRLSLGALPLALGFYALFMPTVLVGDAAWATPRQGPALMWTWAGANLLWWLWAAREWHGLKIRNARTVAAVYSF
ncbi:MAG: hypothetical protein ACREKE_04990, partial [bacterium]